MNQDIVAALVYRMTVLLCGFGSIVMGYRLFRLGVFEKAGELKASWGGKSVLLKAAAPGTFFALFGSAVIAITVWKGFTIETLKPTEKDGLSPLAGVGSDDSEFQKSLRAAAEGRPLSDEQKSILAQGLGLVEKRQVRAK